MEDVLALRMLGAEPSESCGYSMISCDSYASCYSETSCLDEPPTMAVS